MNSLAKAAVSSKFSSVSKSLGLDDKDNVDVEGLSAKELRKFEEENAATRAKLQEQHAKRKAEREKKREEIRAKYGLKDGQGKGNQNGNTRKNISEEDSKGDGKQCNVM